MGGTLFIIFISLLVLWLVLTLFVKPNQTQDRGVYKYFNQKGINLLIDLEKHFNDGTYPINFDTQEYYKQFGIELSEKITIGDIHNQILNERNEDAEHLFSTLFLQMYDLKYAEENETYLCSTEDEVTEINLSKNELLVGKWGGITLKEEKTRVVGITYSGVRMSSGGAFRSVFGSSRIIKHTKTEFEIIDNGWIYLTNKRIIFIGKNNKTRTFSLDKLLNIQMFQDGILLLKENGKSPLFVNTEYVPKPAEPLVHSKPNNIAIVTRYINRVLFDDVKLEKTNPA